MTSEYLYVTNQLEFESSLSLLEGDALACDTETYALPKYGAKGSALDPHTGRISLLICKSRIQQPVIYDIIWLKHLDVCLSSLFDILRSKDYLLLHNARFDLKMFQSTFDWMPENVRDTMVMAKLITNATGSKAGQLQGHGYADLCRDYLDIHITGKGDEQTSTWYCGVNSRNLDNEWWKSKLDYAANDVQYLFKLEDIMLPVLFNPLPDSPLTKSGNTTEEWGLDMREVFDREMQYIPLLAEREYRGMPVSKPMFKALQAAAQTELNAVACRLSRAFDLDLPTDSYFSEDPAPTALKALRSSTQLKQCIQKALKMGNLDNVQAAVIRRIVEILDALSIEVDEENKGGSDVFIDENEELAYHELKEIESSELLKICPIMKDVLTFKRLSKQVSMDLTKYVNPVTGRIHCLVNQLGTATGRTSVSRPNLQQVSARTTIEIELKDKDLFRCTSK